MKLSKVTVNAEGISKKYSENFLSRSIFNREKNNLIALQRFVFIPRLKKISRCGLIMEKINGDFIHHINNPSPTILSSIIRNLQLLHKKWFFHLDLRQRKNYLITPDNKVYFIDFESCIRLPKCGLLRPLAELLRLIDFSGALRIKAKYFNELLTESDKEFLKRFNFVRRFWILRLFKKRKGDL